MTRLTFARGVLPDGGALFKQRSGRAYARVSFGGEVLHQVGDIDVAVYAISEGAHSDPTAESPLLLSYLDVDLSRFDAAPGARLSHLPFECDGAFQSQ